MSEPNRSESSLETGRTQELEKSGHRWTAYDWIVVGMAVVSVGVVVSMVLSSPPLWGRCLHVLDMRNWAWWGWLTVLVAMGVVLAAIRFWPEKNRMVREVPEPEHGADGHGSTERANARTTTKAMQQPGPCLIDRNAVP